MKTKQSLLLALALCALNFAPSTTEAQGTAFTYQGQLTSGTNPAAPATGTFNLIFSLFLDQAGTDPAPGVPSYSVANYFVRDGALTVLVDFGPKVFTGTIYWMQIQVEQVAPNPDGSFTTLTPLVPLTPTPSAIYATVAGGFTGTVPLSQLPTTVVVTGESNVTLTSVTVSGTISGNGSGILSLNGAQVFSVGNGNPLPSSPGSPPTFSAGNFSVGPSGNATTIGSDNTAIGVYALSNNTSGSFNTAVGFNALYVNTETSDNTAIGFNALYSNTNGSDNTGIGFDALYANTSGYENTANGSEALLDNTTGSDNTANGFQALFLNTSGSGNTAIGTGALFDNTSGAGNTAIGLNALFATGGSYNIALGYWAGFYARFGSSNIDIGNQGDPNETDNNIIRIGSGQTTAYIAGVINGNGGGLTNLHVSASQLPAVGNENFFVGPAGNANSANTGSANTAIGYQAFISVTSGYDNTACGEAALQDNSSGNFNTAFGDAVLNDNVTGWENTAIGAFALQFLTGGNGNIALGYEAGSAYAGNEGDNIDIGNPGVQGENNTIRIGTPGVQTNTVIAGVINGNGLGLTDLDASQLTSIGNTNGGDFNFFVGQAGTSTTSGSYNTAIGFIALYEDMNGSNNTAIGAQALTLNQVGNNNTAIGEQALYDNLDSDDNTAIGYQVLISGGGGANTAVGSGALMGLTEGGYNIALGYQAGYAFTGSETGNIDIGNSGSQGEDNIIRIGSDQTATYLAGDVYGKSFNATSDRNAKENFKPVDNQAVLAKVASLPVTEWNFKTDSKGVQHIGPMAQDFQAAFKLSADDKHISVVDEEGVALAAIQGLNLKLEAETKEKDAEIEKLREKAAKVDSLEEQNDSLAARLNELEARVNALAERK